MTFPAVELVDVTKRFTVREGKGRLRRTARTVHAVDGISFRVDAGEMVAYIGPNGAGKSTTVKMLVGILVPSTGEVRVGGVDPSRHRRHVVRRIGVVFGQRTQLWWDLPLVDSFELLRHVYGVPAERHRANLTAFTELLDLGPFLTTPVRQLSLGQRVRGDLTAALLHDPEVIYLDEPTIGLDVVSKDRVREFLAALNAERGTTVLLTTHDLGDVERLCRRLLVVDHGRIIWDGALEDLKARFGTERTLVVDLERPAPPLVVPGATVDRVEGSRQWLRFRRADQSASDLVAAVSRVAALVDLAVQEPEIDDIVRRIYTEGLLQARPDERPRE